MGSKQEQHLGKVFSKLTIIGCVKAKDVGSKKRGYFYVCSCDCGNEKIFPLWALTSGNAKSCGCSKYENIRKHGMFGTREYRTWQGMLTRCNNENCKSYYRYGDRGIVVCERWHKFENFFEDMGYCPDNLSLDRIDVNGNYCKENCRWADASVQSHNQQGRGSCEYLGVTFRPKKGKYEAAIWKGGKHYYLGAFKTSIEAATVYDDNSEELYGDRPNKTTKN